MIVIIDTNVIVSAILRDRKPEEIIMFILQHPDFDWVASMDIIEGANFKTQKYLYFLSK